MPSTSNLPHHFHVWRLAAGDKALFRIARPFRTSQAAGQWQRRRDPDKTRYHVLRCTDPNCLKKFQK